MFGPDSTSQHLSIIHTTLQQGKDRGAHHKSADNASIPSSLIGSCNFHIISIT